MDEGIKVLVRIRPPYEEDYEADIREGPEIQSGGSDVVVFTDQTDASMVKVEGRHSEIVCRFDRVYDMSSSQEDIFESIKGSVDSLVDGFNACIFAYGQTSAGKTHTMIGPDGGTFNEFNTSLWGITPRCVNYLFEKLRILSSENAAIGIGFNFSVYCSYMQLYNEQINDLLADSNSQPTGGLKIREGKLSSKKIPEIFVSGLSEFRVSSADEVIGIIRRGNLQRTKRMTEYNEVSSRSHAILQIFVTLETSDPQSSTMIRKAKFSCVDLAGSEKYNTRSDLSANHIKELKAINMSLSCLGNVIAALSQNNPEKKRYIIFNYGFHFYVLNWAVSLFNFIVSTTPIIIVMKK